MTTQRNITDLADEIDAHVSFALGIRTAVAGMETLSDSIQGGVCELLDTHIERLEASATLATKLNEAARRPQSLAARLKCGGP